MRYFSFICPFFKALCTNSWGVNTFPTIDTEPLLIGSRLGGFVINIYLLRRFYFIPFLNVESVHIFTKIMIGGAAVQYIGRGEGNFTVFDSFVLD